MNASLYMVTPGTLRCFGASVADTQAAAKAAQAAQLAKIQAAQAAAAKARQDAIAAQQQRIAAVQAAQAAQLQRMKDAAAKVQADKAAALIAQTNAINDQIEKQKAANAAPLFTSPVAALTQPAALVQPASAPAASSASSSSSGGSGGVSFLTGSTVAPETVAPSPLAKILPLAGAGLVVAGGLWVLWRKRKGRR